MMAQRFRISPLIRFSLYGLYLGLVLPLPILLAQQTESWVLLWGLGMGLGMGWVLLTAALSQRVDVDEWGLRVSYPGWVPSWLQGGWGLAWDQVVGIHTSSTSQGGLAYYLVSQEQDRYLLPMRIWGFRRLLRIVEAKTGQDTAAVYPYVQPWMYLALALCAGLLLICDGGVILLVLINSPVVSPATHS